MACAGGAARPARRTIAVPLTVVRRSPTDWLMWTVNLADGCSSLPLPSSSALDGWTGVVSDDPALAQPGVIRGIEVQWIPARQEHFALFIGKVAGRARLMRSDSRA
jgi:hypothetical protein